VLGDVDGDGDLDAFVANRGQGNVVWLNDGTGMYIDSGQTLGTAPTTGVALGDVDGDGDLDAWAANDGQANRVWLNDGAGIFVDSGQSLGASESRGVVLGDVDGDGDLDAWVANAGSQGNAVWLNDGMGAYADSGQTLGSADSRGLDVGDVDGDGDLDAWVANEGQSNVVWLNDGTGMYIDSGQILGSADSRGVGLGDVDGDGDLDAFVANEGQSNVVWLNDGMGTFAENGQVLGGAPSRGVALGDVDGDGDLDAWVTNAVHAANTVWLNQPAPPPPATWSEICLPYRIEVTGIGMGDRHHTINPQSLSLTDPSIVGWMLVQVAGRIWRSSPVPNSITLSAGVQEPLTLSMPNTVSRIGYTFEANLSSSDPITASIDGIGDTYLTPRGLVLYSRRATEERWVSVGRTTHNFVWAGGGVYSHTEVIDLPTLAEPVDVIVTAVVMDNDDDARLMVVEASAGNVMASTSAQGPTDGAGLNIVHLTLPLVPAGTNQARVTLRSPSDNGDSLLLVGLNASLTCPTGSTGLGD